MMRNTIRSIEKTALSKCLLVAIFALGACSDAPDFNLGAFNPASYIKDNEAPTTPYARGQLNQLWASAPNALVMVQSADSSDKVQMVGLENNTTLEGDNFLWLRAHRGQGARFDLGSLVEEVGGVPSPFRSLDNRDLRSGEDSMGSYFWKEWRSGSQTNCVVAFRRLDRAARGLPKGTRSLDVFLRNCVVGTIDEALQPVLDNSISYTVNTGSSGISSSDRSLSPLAGPRRQ